MLNDEKEMVYGEGEASVPDPLHIVNQKFSKDYYGALVAAKAWAMVDMEQHPNADDAAKKVCARAKTFVDKIAGTFPGAFE